MGPTPVEGNVNKGTESFAGLGKKEIWSIELGLWGKILWRAKIPSKAWGTRKDARSSRPQEEKSSRKDMIGVWESNAFTERLY